MVVFLCLNRIKNKEKEINFIEYRFGKIWLNFSFLMFKKFFQSKSIFHKILAFLKFSTFVLLF